VSSSPEEIKGIIAGRFLNVPRLVYE